MNGFTISHPLADTWTLPLNVPIARAVAFYAEVHNVPRSECSWRFA